MTSIVTANEEESIGRFSNPYKIDSEKRNKIRIISEVVNRETGEVIIDEYDGSDIKTRIEIEDMVYKKSSEH